MPWPVADIHQSNPLLLEMFEKARDLGIGMRRLDEISGVSHVALWKCRAGKHAMRIDNLTAAVEAMGGRVVIKWRAEDG